MGLMLGLRRFALALMVVGFASEASKGPGRGPLSTVDPGTVFRKAHRVGKLVPGEALAEHSGPLPTNQWWINAALPSTPGSPESNIFQMPYVVMADAGLLHVMIPFEVPPAGQGFNKVFGLDIGATNPLPGPHILAWDQLSVTLFWHDAAGDVGGSAMHMPIVRGSPYITVEYVGSVPQVTSQQQVQIIPGKMWPNIMVDGHATACDGTTKLQGTTFSIDLMQSDHTWIIYAPAGSRWVCHPNPFSLIADGALTGTVRLAMANSCRTGTNAAHCKGTPQGRKDKAYEELLSAHAGTYPVGASIDYTVTGDAGLSQFSWDTKCMQGRACGQLLQLAWPVHWPLLGPEVTSAAEAAIRTPFHDIRGISKPVLGNSWKLQYRLFPDVGLGSPRPVPEQARAQLLEALRGTTGAMWNGSMPDSKFDLPLNYQRAVGDTYFSGKLVGRIARLIQIAHELGESEQAYFKEMVDRLTERVEVWLKLDTETPFVYDATWGGMVSCGCEYEDCWGGCTPHCKNKVDPAELCPSLQPNGGNMNFGNSLYNDHHFHYGYWVYSAGVLAKFNPSWEKRWREQILAIVRDYANPSPEDASFPVTRHMDWFVGFSWAGGLQAMPNGRNQESTSEAINAYYGVYAYGASVEAPFAKDLKDFGRLLTAMETHGADTYWHVRKDGEIYGKGFHHRVVGIMWEHAAEHQTWFGGAPYVVSGIQLLPITPVMEGALAHDWVVQHFPRYKAACDKDPECSKGWAWPMCLEQAVLDPEGAYSCIRSLPKNAFEASNAAASGNSLTNSLHWIATRPAAGGVAPPPVEAAPKPQGPAAPKKQTTTEQPTELPHPTEPSERSGIKEVTTWREGDASRWCYRTEVRYEPLNMHGQLHTQESGLSACQLRCAKVTGCAHFSYWPDGGCHLQDESARLKSEPGAVAGPPSCPGQAPLSNASGSEVFQAISRPRSWSATLPGAAFKGHQLPLPTNAWWESLARPFAPGTKEGGVLQMPYVLEPDLGEIHVSEATVRDFIAMSSDPVDWDKEQDLGLRLGATEGMSEPFMAQWDQLSATLGWRIADKTVMTVPMVRGSPYITAEYDGVTPRLTTRQMLQTQDLLLPQLWVDGKRETCDGIKPLTGKIFLFKLQQSRASWSMFAPEGTDWMCESAPFALVARSPLHGAVRIALADKDHFGNPDEHGPEFVEVLEGHAGTYPVGAAVEYDVAGDVGTVRWVWITKTMKGWQRKPLLQLAWPVHLPLLPPEVREVGVSVPHSNELHGPALAVPGDVWELRYELFPDVGLGSPRPVPESLQPEVLKALRGPDDSGFDLPLKYRLAVGDTYYSGKMIARLARLVAIASELGEQSKGYFKEMLSRLRKRIEVWLRRNSSTPFVYDKSWGGLVSCGCEDFDCEGSCTPHCTNWAPSLAVGCPGLRMPGINFGNAVYNDHHLHYGSFVYGAAVAAKFDPAWELRWRERILMLVRDYANPSAADTSFPVARHKDWFLGFSWAGGLEGDASTRSQEATSEAINSYYAVYVYGASVRDAPFARELRDFGRLLAAMESHGAANYWRLHEKPPSRTNVRPEAELHVPGLGKMPYVASAVHFMPYTPITESYFTEEGLPQRFQEYATVCRKDPQCQGGAWAWPMCLGEAVGDPALAKECLEKLPKDAFDAHNKFSCGNSLTNSLYWIHTRPHVAASGASGTAGGPSPPPPASVPTPAPVPRQPFGVHTLCPGSGAISCSGNQCCPGGTVCPSAAESFRDCPGPAKGIIMTALEGPAVDGPQQRHMHGAATMLAFGTLVTATILAAVGCHRASGTAARGAGAWSPDLHIMHSHVEDPADDAQAGSLAMEGLLANA